MAHVPTNVVFYAGQPSINFRAFIKVDRQQNLFVLKTQHFKNLGLCR